MTAKKTKPSNESWVCRMCGLDVGNEAGMEKHLEDELSCLNVLQERNADLLAALEHLLRSYPGAVGADSVALKAIAKAKGTP